MSEPIIAHLTINGASDAIDWYTKVFGAVEQFRMPAPDGRLLHAEISIDGQTIMLCDAFPDLSPNGNDNSPSALGATTVTLYRNVDDVDAAVAQAVEAGATVHMEPTDMFWGDRFATFRDPFGHEWSVATHIRDVPPEEMEAAIQQMFPQ